MDLGRDATAFHRQNGPAPGILAAIPVPVIPAVAIVVILLEWVVIDPVALSMIIAVVAALMRSEGNAAALEVVADGLSVDRCQQAPRARP